MPHLSFYDILGLDKSASTEDVRRAYKRKALETHPDKLDAKAQPEEKLQTEEQFRKVCEAFETLGDPQKRKAYDGTWSSRGSGELNKKMKERQQWAQKQRDSLDRPKGPAVEPRQRSRGSQERPRRQEEQPDEEFAKKTIESERMRLRLKDRQEWAQKHEEHHKQRMEALAEPPQPDLADLPHQELVTKLVQEMTEALDEVIPGWLERKRKAQQMRAEQASMPKQAGQRK